MRSRRLHIACKDAKLDEQTVRELIEFWTFGETTSARKMDEKQFLSLFKVINDYRRGKVDIRFDENGKLYLEGPGVPVKR